METQTKKFKTTEKSPLGGLEASPSTPSQRRLLHQLCGYNAELKADLVHQFSNGRTTTSLELTQKECNHLIYSLQNWANFDTNNTQHRYILSLCIQKGWTKQSQKYGQIADLNKLSNFLKSKRCPVRKPLMQMDKTECSKIISCLESMTLKHYAKR